MSRSSSFSEPALYYGEIEPSSGLRPSVACFWHWRVRPDVAPFRHSIPPDGCVSLFFVDGAGFGVMGPHVAPAHVPAKGGDRVWGVRFWPGVAPLVLPIESENIRNSMSMLWGPDRPTWLASAGDAFAQAPSEEEATRIWGRTLATAFAGAPAPDEAVVRTAAAIFSDPSAASIPELADRVGLSPRQLRRRCRLAAGLNPKELIRIARVRASLLEAFLDDEWAAVAAANGFSDQAHLVREYRRIAGETPKALLAYLKSIEHGGSARSG